MIKAPPQRKLRNAFMKSVTLTKYTSSDNEDDWGQQTFTVSGTYIIAAEIQEITSEDLSFMVPGTANVGDAWGWFQPTYTKKGMTITIAPEDQVTWNSKTWRIDTIEDAYLGEHLWYRKALMRRVI